jgi:hypothetical protein
MICAFHMQGSVVIEGLFAASRCDFFELNETPKSLGNLNVYQMRCMQAFLRHQRACFDFFAFCSSKQKLENRRRVDDDQRASRSARMSSVGEVFPR